MARIIKFRGKAAAVEQPSSGKMHKAGEWVYGNLCGHPDRIEIEEVIHMSSKYWHTPSTIIDPNTVGQFTGLHDKNGKEIYEGDILKWTDEKDRMDEILFCYVDWHKHLRKFYLSFGEKQKVNDTKTDIFEMMRMGYNYEVIGNIYDNPELLKQEG